MPLTRDPLHENAKEAVLKAKRLSIGVLQRKMQWGYTRAHKVYTMLKMDNEINEKCEVER